MTDKIRDAVATVLTNVSNYPVRAQLYLLGESLGPLIDRVTEAVRSVLAEQGNGRTCHLPHTAPPCVGCTCGARETWDAAVARTTERLLAEQGEPEWEYGYELVESDTRDVLTRGWPFGTAEEAGVEGIRRAAEESHPEYPPILAHVVKRTPAGAWLSAGPWLLVEENTPTRTIGASDEA